MCKCTPEDVRNYGPCDENCAAWPRTDWSYPPDDGFEDQEFMGFKFAVDPSLPDDIVIIQTGKETAVFKVRGE